MVTRLILGIMITSVIVFLASCANKTELIQGNRVNKEIKVFFGEGTHDSFKADPSYPETSKSYKNENLLLLTNDSNSRIVVSISQQRGFLMNGSEVAIDYPVSTGKPSHPTPAGSYRILEKIVTKSSNAYGTVYDIEGNRTGSETPGNVPTGGKFVGAPMPYWMRLTWNGIGHHIGNVPRYPASHACIRGPQSIIPLVFSKTKIGSPFIIKD